MIRPRARLLRALVTVLAGVLAFALAVLAVPAAHAAPNPRDPETAGQQLDAQAAAAAPAGPESKVLTAQWVAPAQAALGAVVPAAVSVRATQAVSDVVVTVTGTGVPQLSDPAPHAAGGLAPGATTQVPSAFSVAREGTGTLHAVITARTSAGRPVRSAVDLDMATGAGQAVLSRSGLLDAQLGALGLQRATLGEPAYQQRVADLQTGGAAQQVFAKPAAAPAAGSTTTVSGTIRYTASDGSLHPAREIRVRLIDADGKTDSDGDPGGSEVDNTTTGADGSYTLTASTLRADGTPRQLKVKALAKGAGFVVRGANAKHAHTIASTPAPATGAPLTVNLTANNTGDNNTAFDVADTMTSAIAETRRINDGKTLTGELTVSFPDANGTNFDPSNNTAYILKDDRFDWDVILHEYGHFVAAVRKLDNNPAGDHSFFDNEAEVYGRSRGLRLAWGEGFASAFALISEDALNVAALGIPNAGDTYYDDTEDGDYHVNLQRNDDTPSLGEDNETSVARTLWHLYKDRNIAIPDTTLIATLSASHPKTLSDAVAALLPAANAAPFDDSAPVRPARVAESNTVGCVLTNQVVAPKLTAPAPGTVVRASTPPTLTWNPDGAGPSNKLNQFYIQFWSPNWDKMLFQSPLQQDNRYRPTQATWSAILRTPDASGQLPPTLNIVIKGSDPADPATGPYKSCGVNVTPNRNG